MWIRLNWLVRGSLPRVRDTNRCNFLSSEERALCVPCGDLNDASIEYLYDNTRRLTSIKHPNRVGVVILRQDYGYDVRDLPTSITETDATAN